jgi:hypothetical protein
MHPYLILCLDGRERRFKSRDLCTILRRGALRTTPQVITSVYILSGSDVVLGCSELFVIFSESSTFTSEEIVLVASAGLDNFSLA